MPALGCGGFFPPVGAPGGGNSPPLLGGPNGNRTRVFGVRGRRPGPLDDGTEFQAKKRLVGGRRSGAAKNYISAFFPVAIHLQNRLYWKVREQQNPENLFLRYIPMGSSYNSSPS